MTVDQLEYYLFGDHVFYDHPGRRDEATSRLAVTDRAVPVGWFRSEHYPWVSLRPADVLLPTQGWKIHVAGTPASADAVCNTVWEYCVSRGVAFKFLRNRTAVLAVNSKYAPRAASGKMITIYPCDEPALEQVLAELGTRLDGEAGPYVLSDLRWGAGPLYVRYGGFARRHLIGEDGHSELAITDQAGRLVADRRRPVFTVPEWLRLPEFLAPHLAARQANSGGAVPYRVVKALHFSNAGGVYLAERSDGGHVVLKEARPLAGLDGSGADATVRLRREEWALRHLSGIDGIPRCHGSFRAGDHAFIVEEYIEGMSLSRWQAIRYPLVIWDEPGDDELAAYTRAALEMYARIAALIDRVHDSGIIFGDLHPGNIIVRPDGSPCLIDFELAHPSTKEVTAGLHAVGFAADLTTRGRMRDQYALAALGLWFFLPLNRILALAPEKLDQYIEFVAHRFPVSHAFLACIRGVMASSARSAGEKGGASPRTRDWIGDQPAIRRSMAAAVLTSAQPARSDRLFPGDIAQFTHDAVGLAYGAGGVLWALSVTGQGRYPQHEEWLIQAARTPGGCAGFYEGLHGLAYVCDHFGYGKDASALLERAVAADRALRSLDLYSGLAGSGLNLLHFAARDGERDFLELAIGIGERVVARLAAPSEPDAAQWPKSSVGLLRGWSGPALFLLRLSSATGDGQYLDAAVRALHRDLDRCVSTVSGGLEVAAHGMSTLAYLNNGSAGVALVADEILEHRPDARLTEALPGLVRACSAEIAVQANLFHGRAGLIAAVTRAGARVGRDMRPTLARHLRALDLHALSYRGHLAFPGDGSLRLSMDLATGTAGVLLATHSATARLADFLPFFSARPGWCGRDAPECLPADERASVSGRDVLARHVPSGTSTS